MDTLPKIKTQSNAKNKIMRAARMLPFLFSCLAARMSSRYSTGGFLCAFLPSECLQASPRHLKGYKKKDGRIHLGQSFKKKKS
jgi:hypothetical protein